jgi:hypothetical protein
VAKLIESAVDEELAAAQTTSHRLANLISTNSMTIISLRLPVLQYAQHQTELFAHIAQALQQIH